MVITCFTAVGILIESWEIPEPELGPTTSRLPPVSAHQWAESASSSGYWGDDDGPVDLAGRPRGRRYSGGGGGHHQEALQWVPGGEILNPCI